VYYIPVDGELHKGIPFQVYVHKVDTDAERARIWLRRARAVLDLADPPEPSADCAYCDRALLAGTLAGKIEALA